jgi:hypothetical protein
MSITQEQLNNLKLHLKCCFADKGKELIDRINKGKEDNCKCKTKKLFLLGELINIINCYELENKVVIHKPEIPGTQETIYQVQIVLPSEDSENRDEGNNIQSTFRIFLDGDPIGSSLTIEDIIDFMLDLGFFGSSEYLGLDLTEPWEDGDYSSLEYNFYTNSIDVYNEFFNDNYTVLSNFSGIFAFIEVFLLEIGEPGIEGDIQEYTKEQLNCLDYSTFLQILNYVNTECDCCINGRPQITKIEEEKSWFPAQEFPEQEFPEQTCICISGKVDDNQGFQINSCSYDTNYSFTIPDNSRLGDFEFSYNSEDNIWILTADNVEVGTNVTLNGTWDIEESAGVGNNIVVTLGGC